MLEINTAGATYSKKFNNDISEFYINGLNDSFRQNFIESDSVCELPEKQHIRLCESIKKDSQINELNEQIVKMNRENTSLQKSRNPDKDALISANNKLIETLKLQLLTLYNPDKTTSSTTKYYINYHD
jgi:hypothetical protein